ncbi:MAG TPA: hypothetical protein VN892_05525 [Solirubrobacteraceae bacterium]|nr:hypothetical protein [Solirubrobacteraceae bacterium]
MAAIEATIIILWFVGLVPRQSLRTGAAAIMVAIGLAGAAAALAAFRRRDLLGR